MSKSGFSMVPVFKLKVEEKGTIKDIKEIIVRIHGLPTCLNGQIVEMGNDVKGIIMGFDEKDVLVLVLGDAGRLRMGGEVKGVSEPFRIPVGDAFIGRMVTALGEPCDRQGDVEAVEYSPVLKESLPIPARALVDEFFATGTKVIDLVTPIAKGQRQLILGDRLTGKTVIAVDAVLNQADRDCVCIYCCVGKSMSSLEKLMTILNSRNALSYTIVMVATDSSPVGEQYLVPFSAATMGEYFTARGQDVLIVFDDLTKHAWAYRQLSLLMDRPPGREAYPGDIFYVQTQLMERAGKFNDEHGGASMTFLAIAETIQSDLTGYIPSNLVSMCDGQIFMSTQSFAEGYRPAVDLGLSVSIIGGRVQPPILKALSATLRADHARYNEVSKLSRLQTGLSGEGAEVVSRGEAIMAVLQQPEHQPVSLVEQVLMLHVLDKGLISGIGRDEVERFSSEILAFAKQKDQALLNEIEKRQRLTVDISKRLDAIVLEYFAMSFSGTEG